MLPPASCNQPGRLGRKCLKVALRAVPIRSCSRWGLPCRGRCRPRGGLLPHPFTLTPPANRSLAAIRSHWTDLQAGRFPFCGTFPEVALAGACPAPSFRGARTFLPAILANDGAAARPTGNPYKGFYAAKRNGVSARANDPSWRRDASPPSGNRRPRPGSCAWHHGRHCISGSSRRSFRRRACVRRRDISSRI